MKPLSIKQPFSARLARALECAALSLVVAAALALAATSLFASARINPANYDMLQIHLFEENERTNLVIAVFGVLAMALAGAIPVTKRSNRITAAAVLLLLGMFGAVWALSVKAHAESDGDVLIQMAERFLAGDYSVVQSPSGFDHIYLVQSPYQVGLLACLQLFVAVFGATGALPVIRLMNVALLISSYAALLLMTQRVFRSERITFVTILLLCVFIQPVFNCTLVYGIVPAFACGVWAFYFTVRYLQDGKLWNMIPAAALLAAAVYVRTSAWVLVVAVVIVLLLHALREKKIAPVLVAILAVALAAPWCGVTQKAYEKQTGTEFGPGYPKTFWIAMCLQDGWKGPGWHVQEYQGMMRATYGDDAAGVGRRAEQDIVKKLEEFRQNPDRALEYYYEKLVTMWNEPTFTSIWITKSVPSYTEPGALTNFFYSDGFDTAFRLLMKKALLGVYAGFAIASVFLFRRGGTERLLLPLYLLGGMFFHLIMEAKSQYVLEYLPLMLPLAAYGSISLGEWILRLFRRKRTAEIGAEEGKT